MGPAELMALGASAAKFITNVQREEEEEEEEEEDS